MNVETDPIETASIRVLSQTCRTVLERLFREEEAHDTVQINETGHWASRQFSEFNIWCAKVGINCEGRRSVDVRLKDVPETCEMIRGLLQSLDQDLREMKEPVYKALDDGSNHDDASSSDSGSSSLSFDSLSSISQTGTGTSIDEVNLAERQMKALRGHIEETIDRLHGHASQIDKAGDKHRQERLKVYMRKDGSKFAYNGYLELAYRKAKVQFQGAMEIFHKRMAESFARRRIRFEYLKEHQQKRAIEATRIEHSSAIPAVPIAKRRGPDVLQPLPTKDNEASLIVDITARRLEDLRSDTVYSATEHTKLEIGPITRRQERAESVASVALRNFEFPRAPQVFGGGFQCPYCRLDFRASEAQPSRWSQHVLQDFEPYFCIFEKCQAPFDVPNTFDGLLIHLQEHMEERFHVDIPNGAHQDFDETGFEAYLNHDGNCSQETLELMKEVSQRKSALILKECPFCGGYPDDLERVYPIPSKHDAQMELRKYIKRHFHDIALFLPPYRDDISDRNDVSVAASDLSHKTPVDGLHDPEYFVTECDRADCDCKSGAGNGALDQLPMPLPPSDLENDANVEDFWFQYFPGMPRYDRSHLTEDDCLKDEHLRELIAAKARRGLKMTGADHKTSVEFAVPDGPASLTSSANINIGGSTRRKRVIICVDGTWYNEDGLEGHGRGNNSTIFRIYASVKRGIVIDSDGNKIEQIAKYFPGIGVEKPRLEKFNDGVTGEGCKKQIEDIYWECLKETENENDEVWLFGFSRGAFVVRAVAALLQSFAIKVPPAGSDGLLERIKRFGKKKKAESTGMNGPLLRLRDNGRPTPKIMFLGLFDTVKGIAAQDDTDISDIGSTVQIRHALALNEERVAFPILHFDSKAGVLDEQTRNYYLQAWFVGAHADMGGGARHDGLSLYPLQWMLIESRDQGLVLSYDPPSTVASNAMQNPLHLAFPNSSLVSAAAGQVDNRYNPNGTDSIAPQRWTFRYSSGLEITMYDLRHSHQHGNLQRVELRKSKRRRRSSVQPTHEVHINYGMVGFWGRDKRRIFDVNTVGNLIDYHETSRNGTIVHPSVYFLLHTYVSLGLGEALKTLLLDLKIYREKARITYVQDHADGLSDPWIQYVLPNATSCRILICGQIGVGKSALLNRVFGVTMVGMYYSAFKRGNADQQKTPESPDRRGEHIIEEGLEMDQQPGIIIHDSEGFQAGDEKQVIAVKNFLKLRSGNAKAPENLHAIWLCIETSSPRPVQSQLSDVLKIVHTVTPSIPIVIVGTKKDMFLFVKKYEHGTKSPRPSDAEILSERRSVWMDKFKTDQEIRGFWPHLNIQFAFVSNDDDDSIKELMRVTIGSLVK